MSTQAAGKVNVVLSVNQVNFTAAMKDAQKQLDAFAGKSRQAGHATVSSQQAASAAVRVFEGGMTNSIRAVERFITTIPGVGAALKVAFPLIGGVAFGAMILETGQKVAAFIKQVDEMPKTIQKGFESLSLSQKTANDALDVTNDKLQNSIDKLEKRPTDGLKLGMDEAKLSADHLAESISGASDKLTALLSTNHINGLQALWGMWGTASTAGVEGTAKYFNQRISTDSGNYADDPSDKNHSTMIGDVTAAIREATASLKVENDKRDAPATTAEKLAGSVAGLSGPLSLRPDNSSVIADLTGEVNYYKGLLRTDSATTKNQGLQKQEDSDQDKKNAADLAKQQTEAAKTAATARVAAMQTSLDSLKLQYNLSIKATYDYWEQKKSTELAGGTAYNEIVAKQAELAVQAASKAHETIQKAIADATRSGAEDSTTGPALLNRSNRFMQQQAVKDGGEQTQGYVDSNQLAIDQASNDARAQEAKLTDEAGKSMSRYAAALQLANAHAQEFKTTQTALQAILNARKDDQRTNPSRENERAVTTAQTSLDNANTQRGIQIGNDANSITPPSTSITAGFDDAINDFVNASRDGAEQMRSLVTNTLQGLNSQLVNAMTGGKTNFKQFGLGVTRNVAGAALEKGEGAITGAFGGGKLGTSQGNAMWVRMANTGMSGGGSKGGPLGSLIGDGSNKNPSSKSSGGFMGFIKGLFGLGGAGGSGGAEMAGVPAGGGESVDFPAFANGGQIDGPAMVGEQGPEIWTPPEAGGKIIPNKDVSSAVGSGNGSNFSYSIDARGTDPVQTEMRVKAAIAQSHKSAVHQALIQNQQQAKRRPARRG